MAAIACSMKPKTSFNGSATGRSKPAITPSNGAPTFAGRSKSASTAVRTVPGKLTFSDSQTGSLDIDTLANGSATTGAGIASFLLGIPEFVCTTEHRARDSIPLCARRGCSSLDRTRGVLRRSSRSPMDSGTKIIFRRRRRNLGALEHSIPSTGEVVVAGFGNVPRNMGIQAYNLGFAPRLGIAYQAAPTWVIRTGYGRSFNAAGVGAVWAQNPEIDPPVQFVQNLNPSNQYSSAIPTFLTSGHVPCRRARISHPVDIRCRRVFPCIFSLIRLARTASRYRIRGTSPYSTKSFPA